MSHSEGRILAPGLGWDEVLSRFAAHGSNDVYFDHRYPSLYALDETRCEAFVYEEGHDTFLFPYLKSPIPRQLSGGRYWDFESAYGYSGPLSTTHRERFLRDAWACFRRHCADGGLVAGFIRFHPLLRNESFVPEGVMNVRPNRTTVFIGLQRDAKTVWADYCEDNRARINKAVRSGVIVTRHETIQALRDFAVLYGRRMNEVGAHDSYRFGQRYFESIEGLGEGRWAVYLASVGTKLLGGAVILLSDNFAHYHLSGSPKEFHRYGPNNLLRHCVILSLIGKRQSYLHFGGGKTCSPEDPLLKFKKRFSKEEALFCTGEFVVNEPLYGEMCSRWEAHHPEKAQACRHMVLRYRL